MCQFLFVTIMNAIQYIDDTVIVHDRPINVLSLLDIRSVYWSLNLTDSTKKRNRA